MKKEGLFSGKEGNMLFLVDALEFEMFMEYQGCSVQHSAGHLSLKSKGDIYVKYK